MTSSGYPHFCDLFLSVVQVLKGCLLVFFSAIPVHVHCVGEGLAQRDPTAAWGM